MLGKIPSRAQGRIANNLIHAHASIFTLDQTQDSNCSRRTAQVSALCRVFDIVIHRADACLASITPHGECRFDAAISPTSVLAENYSQLNGCRMPAVTKHQKAREAWYMPTHCSYGWKSS
jgi:hypothetical protein